MESLDAAPNAEYASLLTISSPKDTAQGADYGPVDRNQNFQRLGQEHIYAQVSQNGPVNGILPLHLESKSKTVTKKDKSKVLSNKILLHNAVLLRNPVLSLTHSSSEPDVRQSNQNVPNLCPNNYGSLNPTKVDNNASIQKSEAPNDSAVFSISGRRVVVSSGFKGNGNPKNPSQTVSTSEFPNGGSNLWSRRSSIESQTERKRRKLQVCTDCFSLCLFIPGTVLCIISPWLLVPIYIIPNFLGNQFQTLIWISCIGSAILVFMGCMVGNMVWYRKGEDWKCRLHCGKGHKNHYWGDSLTTKRTTHTV